MTTDALLSRELTSLREEVSAAHQRRLSQTAERGAGPSPAPAQSEDVGDVQQFRGELRELVDVIKEFVSDVEKTASAQPAATAIGAMVVGILIGRLLGRH